MIRFHLDENADWAIAEGLRRHGFDATTTPPDVPKQTSDPEQIAWCMRQQRVMITQDGDMLITAATGAEHAGIAYYRPRSRTYGQLISTLVNLARRLTAEQMRNHVEYL